MIDSCTEFCHKFFLSFNAKKSKVMLFGKKGVDLPKPLSLSGSNIDYVDEWKYLGTTLKSGFHLCFAARPDIASFFRATNSLVHSLPGVHEHVLVSLIYQNCVPILSYACAVKEFSATDMSNCDVAVNNALRRAFGFSRWESIRTLREMFGLKSLYKVFNAVLLITTKSSATLFLNCLTE